MAKRLLSETNFDGRERSAKIRRMGAVDRAQQAEIDELQALFKPEKKTFFSYNTDDRTPCLTGTLGTTTGPIVISPWDLITQGTASTNRLGDEMVVNNFTLHFDAIWHSLAFSKYYVDGFIRVDALWLEFDTDFATTYASPGAQWGANFMHQATSASSYFRFMSGKGPVDRSDSDLVDAGICAKRWIFRMPSQCRNKSSVNWKADFPYWNATLSMVGNAAITNQQAVGDNPDHCNVRRSYDCKFPLPKRGFRMRYVRGSTTQVENKHIPVFRIAYLGYNNNRSSMSATQSTALLNDGVTIDVVANKAVFTDM